MFSKRFLGVKIALLLCLIGIAPLLWAQQSQFAYNQGVPIHYRVFGSGEPLLIINGGPGLDSDGFVYLAKKLSKHNQCIIYDQRGMGLSRVAIPDKNTINMAQMAQDMEVLRQHLGLEAWHILGHSFGGIMATYYAHLYPERIKKLILSSSGGMDMAFMQTIGGEINKKLSKEERKQLAYWTDKLEKGDTSYQTRFERAKVLAKPYLQNPEHIPTLAERLTRVNYEINELVVQDLLAMNYDYTEKFKQFTKPVLVLHGRQDVIQVRIAQKTAASFSKSRLVLLNNTAHYGWLDSPDRYFAEIETFLKVQ